MTARILLAIAILLSFVSNSFAEELAGENSFLDKLEYDSFQYFIGEMNPENGLIKDSSRPGAPASVAVVGFGLTSICIGASRGWISEEEAYEKILRILKTFDAVVPNEHGFFYHFLDMRTAKRAWNSEVSSIDTALFIAGALYAGEYFKDTEIEYLALRIYRRVEWPWMMNGKKIICMGWKPETDFLRYYWDSYSEALILYALAIGSPTHPIEKEAWFEWKRFTGSYGEYDVVYSYFGSLFTYQYSQAWIDFRQITDKDGTNYFTNSINASLANKAFCVDSMNRFKTYEENTWGLTACIGPSGYNGYGAEPGKAFHDGTIAPCGMAGSMVFAGQDVMKGLEHIYENYGKFIYGKYGFKDAFNVDQNWWAEEYLGIDVGITVLMIENFRTGAIWEKFMKLKPIRRWIAECF